MVRVWGPGDTQQGHRDAVPHRGEVPQVGFTGSSGTQRGSEGETWTQRSLSLQMGCDSSGPSRVPGWAEGTASLV